MRFGLTQKALTFALALTSAVPLLTSGEIGAAFVALFCVLFVTAWFLRPSLTENPVYRRTVTGVVAAAMGMQLVRLFSGAPMAMLAMELVTLLLGAKLCTRARAADDSQIVILAFLHIIAATVTMTDLLYGVAFLLFVALSSPMLALSYLRQEIEHRFAAKSGMRRDDEMVERLFNSKRIVSLRFLFGSALLTVPILIITAVLFVIFPRIGFGFLGKGSETKASVGFGNEVVLGDLDIVRLEDTVVMRLLPVEMKSAPPARMDVKIKGAVFDAFDGRRWQKSIKPNWSTLSSDDQPESSTYFLHAKSDAPATRRFEVFLEPLKPPFVFVPEGTGRIHLDPVADRNGITRRKLDANVYGELKYDDTMGVGLRYTVDLTDAPSVGAPPMGNLRFTGLYPGSARLEALAERLAGDGPPKEKAARLVRRLKSDYRYALKLSDDKKNRAEATALDRFLFSRKSGTCEHFATALTLMLRSVNIPARLVTGFQGADWNAIGGFYSVRQRFAHSWTEAFLDGRWTPLDATPASGEYWAHSRTSTLSLFVDTLRMRWQKHVVSYDLSTQGKLALGLWKRFRNNRAVAPFALLPTATRAVGIALCIAIFLAAATLFIQYHRRLPTPRRQSRRDRRTERAAASLIHSLDHRLGRLGFRRSPEVTPLEHLNRLTETVSFPLENAFDVLRRYHEVRFGRGAFSEGEVKRLTARIKRIGAPPK